MEMYTHMHKRAIPSTCFADWGRTGLTLAASLVPIDFVVIVPDIAGARILAIFLCVAPLFAKLGGSTLAG